MARKMKKVSAVASDRFELTEETRKVCGTTVYRIRAKKTFTTVPATLSTATIIPHTMQLPALSGFLQLATPIIPATNSATALIIINITDV